MEMEMLFQLIGNVGFPIAAFAAMYYMCNTTLGEFRQSMDNFKESNHELISQVKNLCCTMESQQPKKEG